MKIAYLGLLLMLSCHTTNEEKVLPSQVIYGDNDLQDISSLPLSIKKNASAIAAMVNKKNISIGNHGFEFLVDKKARKFCDGAGDGYAECTGFLISPQIILTAGHCFQSEDLIPERECRNFAWIFDYKKNGTFSSENFYHCNKVLALETSENGPDYALILLDRVVGQRKPVELDFNHELKYRQEVYLIGHSLGRPLTYSGPSLVYTINDEHQFLTMLDGFSGNSGSPVFSKESHKVIGIHVAGEGSELLYNETKSCYELKHCAQSIQSPCAYSTELKISNLLQIKNFLPAKK